MRRSRQRVLVLATGVITGVISTTAVSACSSAPDAVHAPSSSAPTSAASPAIPMADDGLPFDAMPVTAGRQDNTECPYLDTQWVANTNGQRVVGHSIDTRFSTPACVFWSYSDQPQLTVIVREMPNEEAAIHVVDWAAPVDTTEPAEEPEGWSGGRLGSPGRALYAVQKDNHAVVVFSDQDQSLKAELVAKEVINNLRL